MVVASTGEMESAEAFTKSCNVYVSRHDAVVLVAAVWNHAGLFAEMVDGVSRGSQADIDELGAIITSKLAACRFEPSFNYRDLKKSDWPAFRASGLKTIRAFEDGFVRIDVRGENFSTLAWEVSSPPFFNGARLVSRRSPVGGSGAQGDWLIEFAQFFIEVETKTKTA